jgi:hypothetical protein
VNDPVHDRAPVVPPPVLFAVDGDATATEVAALVAVLQGLRAGTPAPRRPRAEWSSPHRVVSRSHAAGPGAWRSSSLPR